MTRLYELTALRRPLGSDRRKARSTVRWVLEWIFLWRADRCMRAGIRWRERKDRLWR